MYDDVCLRCHDSTGTPYHACNAPLAGAHQSVKCIDCHHPHYQTQQLWYGRKYYKSDYEIAYGAGSVTGTETIPVIGLLTEITFSSITFKSDWTLSDLEAKTSEGRGMLFLPNRNSPYNSLMIYEVSDNGDGTGSIKVKGSLAVVSSSGFAVAYGQVIKREIPYVSASGEPVLIFDQEGKYGFAHNDGLGQDGTDSTPNGICQVCHTQTNHWRNDGTYTDDHFSGQNCTQNCHKHTNGFAHGGGEGEDCIDCHNTGSHVVHIDKNDPRGPAITCEVCHDFDNMPYFKSGEGVAPYDLSETNVCNTCHSDEGAYDGVNDADLGVKYGNNGEMKYNWTNGIYESNKVTLKPGNEKWCATCHDESPANSKKDGSGVAAPNVIGDEDGAYAYGTGYGFYKTGHGLASNIAFPSSGGVATGAGLECNACHDYALRHIDGDDRTYAAQSPDIYRTGFRLKYVNLGDGDINPMQLPWPDTFELKSATKERFALCASCHNPDPFVGNNDDTNLTYSSVNNHARHLAANSGMQNRYDSDWNGSYESRINCTVCHNVHGSPRLAMMRDGSLVNREPGYEIWYMNDDTENVYNNSTPPEPQDLTLIQSTGIIMYENSTNGRMCSACHNREFTSEYPRDAFRWEGDIPALDWTREPYYENRGIHTDRLFNATETIPFRVKYFDPNNDPPSSVEVWIDLNDDLDFDDIGEITAMVKDNPSDVTYTDGVIYKASVSVSDPGDKAMEYRFYASDGTNVAVGNPAMIQNFVWDANFIREVPAEYDSIQAAIDIAYDGNIIEVSDGTYNENINYGSKYIIVQSVNGASATSITGSGSDNPVVAFSGTATADAVLDGFTIDNVDSGTYYSMNGIKVSNGATPVIKNSTVTGNNMRGKGAGILIDGGAATIENCTIDSNSTSYEQGGGVYLINGSATTTITDSSISNNTAKTNGGGLYVENSAIELTNVTMDGNRSNESSGGGACFNGDVNATISGTSISSNTSKYSGAGLYFNGDVSGVASGCLTISNSTIDSNTNNTTTTSNGGGLYLTNIGCTLSITDTSITSNMVRNNGGGIYAANAAISMSGSTIDGNTASENDGGGLLLSGSGPSSISNTVITNNTAKYSGGGIRLSSTNTILTSVTVNTNHSTNGVGGGMNINGGTVSLAESTVNGNTGGTNVGGIWITGSATFSAEKCYIQGNRSGGNSGTGGLGLDSGSSATLSNCNITGNITGTNYWSSGGGIASNGTLNMYHCTVAGNWANRSGGGIQVNGGNATIDSCLLWDNTASDANSRDIRVGGGAASVTYSAIKNGSGYTGANNITAITGQVFVTPDYAANGNPKTGGNYHILVEAVEAIDTANPASAVTEDIDGDSRPLDGPDGDTDEEFDMGADEYAP